MQNNVLARHLTALCICVCLLLVSSPFLKAQDGKFPENSLVKDSIYLEVDTALNIYLVQSGPVNKMEKEHGPSPFSSLPVTHTYRRVDALDIVHDAHDYGEDVLPVFYRVRPKETVFRIARVYFKMPILHLMDLNGMDTTHLDIGQTLLIGWIRSSNNNMATAAGPDSVTMPFQPVLSRPDTVTFNPKPVSEEKGLALWDKHMQIGGGLIAMHPTARINSQIEIVNPMFNRSIKAKVIGNIPPNRYPGDISVIVSPEVARALGVLDRRFYVVLRYYE